MHRKTTKQIIHGQGDGKHAIDIEQSKSYMNRGHGRSCIDRGQNESYA